MNKRILKALAILLALALGGANALAVQVAGPGELPLVDEKITLSAFARMNAAVDDIDTNTMTLWYEDLTNVHIDWEIPPANEATTKLNLSLASGDYPDMYWNITLSTAQIVMYAEMGVLIPITEYVENNTKYYKETLAAYPQIKEMITAPDGNLYAMLRTDGGLHVLASNKGFVYEPWLTQLELAMPETIEEFEAMLIRFRDEDMNGNGDASDEVPIMGSTTNNPVYWLLSPFELVTTKMLNVKDGKVYAAFATDRYREGLAWVKRLYDEGLIARDSFVQDNTQLQTIVSRPDEMVVGVSAGVYELSFADLNGMPTAYSDFTAIPPLEGPYGRQAIYNDGFAIMNTFFTSACEYPQVAVMWNDYWYSEEGMLINLVGFEGDEFEWVNEPSINGKTPSLFKKVESYSATQNINWAHSGPRLQTSDLRYTVTDIPGSNETSLYTESLKYTPYFPEEYLPGILWFDVEAANELSALETVILTYAREAMTQFVVGDLDIEADWDAYLAELEAMGMARWVALYQQAIE